MADAAVNKHNEQLQSTNPSTPKTSKKCASELAEVEGNDAPVWEEEEEETKEKDPELDGDEAWLPTEPSSRSFDFCVAWLSKKNLCHGNPS